MRTRSPRPAAWAIGFGPFGAVARAGFPPTQRRPIANLARGKVRAFGPLKVAASGTKTPPQNRRSLPNHRRGLKGNAPGERGMSRLFSVGPTGQPFAGRTVGPLDRCTVTTVLRSPGRCPELGELGECASLSGQPSLRRHGAGGGGEMLEQGRLSGQPSPRRHGAGGGAEMLEQGRLSGQPSLRRHGAGGGGEMLSRERGGRSGQPSLRRHGAGGGGETLSGGPAVAGELERGGGGRSGQSSRRRHGAGGGVETLSGGPAVAGGTCAGREGGRYRPFIFPARATG